MIDYDDVPYRCPRCRCENDEDDDAEEKTTFSSLSALRRHVLERHIRPADDVSETETRRRPRTVRRMEPAKTTAHVDKNVREIFSSDRVAINRRGKGRRYAGGGGDAGWSDGGGGGVAKIVADRQNRDWKEVLDLVRRRMETVGGTAAVPAEMTTVSSTDSVEREAKLKRLADMLEMKDAELEKTKKELHNLTEEGKNFERERADLARRKDDDSWERVAELKRLVDARDEVVEAKQRWVRRRAASV